MNPLTTLVITGVLGGGLVQGIATLISSRSTAKKLATERKSIDAKLPAEVDSVIVTGAEQAVLSMSKALEAADRRIAELERREKAAERTIEQLRRDVADLRRRLDECNDRAIQLSERLSSIDNNPGG